MEKDEARNETSPPCEGGGHLRQAIALAHALADTLARGPEDAPYSLRLGRALTLDVVELLEEAARP